MKKNSLYHSIVIMVFIVFTSHSFAQKVFPVQPSTAYEVTGSKKIIDSESIVFGPGTWIKWYLD